MFAGPAWLTKNQERPIVLRRRRERIKTTSNWLLFYYHFQRDQAKANLIWNYKTREELREALGKCFKENVLKNAILIFYYFIDPLKI
jgi:hypothetical protein